MQGEEPTFKGSTRVGSGLTRKYWSSVEMIESHEQRHRQTKRDRDWQRRTETDRGRQRQKETDREKDRSLMRQTDTDKDTYRNYVTEIYTKDRERESE